MEILVGCDPEVFVKRGKTFVSAHGMIPGTKEEPYVVPFGAVQVDGMALEFNIDPARNEEEFLHNIRSVLATLEGMIPEGHKIEITPTATFSLKHFDLQPEKAKELGCDPDFNAYKDGDENDKPDNRSRMRAGAGHVHLGYTSGEDPKDPVHIIRCCTLVKHLDAYLGVPSLLWDDDTRRRSMYGKAGCFRPKPYGVEYRTLSNAWLRDDDHIRYVYRQSVAAIQSLMAGERFDKKYDRFASIINSSNRPMSVVELDNTLINIEKPPLFSSATSQAEVYGQYGKYKDINDFLREPFVRAA